jgi:hypothetical protein
LTTIFKLLKCSQNEMKVLNGITARFPLILSLSKLQSVNSSRFYKHNIRVINKENSEALGGEQMESYSTD